MSLSVCCLVAVAFTCQIWVTDSTTKMDYNDANTPGHDLAAAGDHSRLSGNSLVSYENGVKYIHLAGIFPIGGKEGWQGGQVRETAAHLSCFGCIATSKYVYVAVLLTVKARKPRARMDFNSDEDFPYKIFLSL